MAVLFRTRTALRICFGFLVVASLVLVGSQIALVKQRGISGEAQSAWVAAKRIEAVRTNAARRLQGIEALMNEAERTDFLADAWDERRFGIKQSSMTRKAANRLLGEITTSRGRIFAAEQFELSVKDPQDGLFSHPSLPDADLAVSLRGSLLYRAKAASK